MNSYKVFFYYVLIVFFYKSTIFAQTATKLPDQKSTKPKTAESIEELIQQQDQQYMQQKQLQMQQQYQKNYQSSGGAYGSIISQDSTKSDYESTNQVSSMKDLVGDVKSILKYVPGNASQALETYLEVTRPDKYNSDGSVGGGNKGIISYFKDVYSSPTPAAKCLNLKAQLFYKFIDNRDRLRASPNSGPLQGRPSLQTRVEQSELEPGWVWKKAMQLTNNDPNEAMMIIGLCGHDDTGGREQGINRQNIDHEEKSRLNKKFGKSILWENNEISKFVCPDQNSLFYFPGSLNKKADISENLKKKIASVQAPNKGASVIPAKYYHVYGGAFMACKMIQDGVSKSAAKDYPQKFVSVYRRARMCSEAQIMKKRADLVNSKFQIALQEAAMNEKNQMNVVSYLESLDPADCLGLFSGERRSIAANICGRIRDDKKYAEKFIDRSFAGKMYFEQQNCPSSQSGQLTDAMRAFSAGPQNAFDFNNEFNCSNIPSSTCESSKKVLDTWRVDFEWTMEQQNAGARFAAENCKPKPKDKKSDDPSKKCEISDSFFDDYYEKAGSTSTAQPKSSETGN